ncbi:hypothetical protein C8R44DRAFT_892225 [Mycena epipterygia]|nr:hypothetical protein C8R44DRAFT_892225 [Mycena epipterygia]
MPDEKNPHLCKAWNKSWYVSPRVNPLVLCLKYAMAMIYTGGIAPIVTVYGVGNLHHISYESHTSSRSVVGI